jgi:hypothetical protein
MGPDPDDIEAMAVAEPRTEAPPEEKPAREPISPKAESTPRIMFSDEDMRPQQPARPAERVSAGRQPDFVPFDMVAYSAKADQEIDQAVNQWTRTKADPLLRRLGELPDPSRFTAERLAEMSPEEKHKYDQGVMERMKVETFLAMIPEQQAMVRTQLKNTAATGHSLLLRSMTDYPDIAQDLADAAQHVSADMLARPDTYEFLANQIYGKRHREQMQKQRMRSTAGKLGMSGRSGSSAQAPDFQVAMGAQDTLLKMGVKREYVEETLNRVRDKMNRG